jgi:hypothetical protein
MSPAAVGEQSTAGYRWRAIDTVRGASPDTLVVHLPAESVTTVSTKIQGSPSVVLPDDADASSIAVWPNPAYDHVIVRHSGAGAGALSVVVTDIYGDRALVRQLHQSALETTLDISQLMSGTYFVLLRSGDGTMTVRFTVLR